MNTTSFRAFQLERGVNRVRFNEGERAFGVTQNGVLLILTDTANCYMPYSADPSTWFAHDADNKTPVRLIHCIRENVDALYGTPAEQTYLGCWYSQREHTLLCAFDATDVLNKMRETK